MVNGPDIEDLQNQINALRRECEALKGSESKHQDAQRLALMQVREATWNLTSTTAVFDLLPAVSTALKLVKIPVANCGLNLIDTHDPPMMRTYVYYGEGQAEYQGTWGLNDIHSFAGKTAQIWRAGKPYFRRDLNQEPAGGDSDHLQRVFGPVRSLLEIPFSRGTLILTHALPEAFSERDFTFLLMLGDVISDGLRRQEAVEDLGRSEARYQRLVETPNLVVMLVDPIGEYIYLSPQIGQWTGREPTDFYADSSLGQKMVHTDDRQAVEEAIARTLRGEAVHDLECRWHRDNDQQMWVSQSLFPIYETVEARALDKVDLIQIITQDITVRKEAEAVLKRDAEQLQHLVDERTAALSQAVEVLQKEVSERQRAQETNTQLEKALQQAQKLQAVGQLTAGIAHNFNNMLMVILGNIGIALRSADQQMRPPLQDAESTSLKAAEMVKQLLTFSRRGEIAEQDVLDTQAIIADITAICRKTFDRQISIEMRTDAKLPVILGDASQLEQVFLNLCLNSRDALEESTAAKPQILLDASFIKELKRPQIANPEAPVGPFIRIAVTDNGVGMDAETRERLFEPFFTTKEAGKGTGLGLATAYAIVDQHRGWLEVDSQPGKGTTIVVFLPAKKTTPRRVRQAPAEKSLGGTETILVIDDEEEIRKLLALSLRRHGYTVVLAQDGEDGVAQFMRHQGEISLVVLDLLMPQLSGKATLARLLAIKPELKVIISTGLANEDLRAAGAKAVLYKPYQENVVLEKIRQVLDD